MANPEAVKVKRKSDGKVVIINKEDYDANPEMGKIVDGVEAPASEPAPAPEPVSTPHVETVDVTNVSTTSASEDEEERKEYPRASRGGKKGSLVS